MRVSFARLSPRASLPRRMSADAAGLDLFACVEQEQPLPPGGRALVPTGVQLQLPSGFEGQVRPRSGLALRHGITVLNAPGTIDADYRGELSVLLVNLGDAPFVVRHGDRIAQLVIAPVCMAEPVEAPPVDPDASSGRGAGGYGSTGGFGPAPAPTPDS
ncbi:dUTP diphosphatase [Paraliomyxa miuraensis]|uniref:dUTP diphosphatase n=1 Tax=Paraliomyxa miuraensis TaxID=376150 RepID=UPI002257DFD5|nr:dUTP diphosphatase [Paraliomyxa miuraensis]MCX4244624.1 dUTP diphosphatase [Paraliomyxa miuraensis]